MSQFKIQVEHCRARQQCLLEEMHRFDCSLVVVSRAEHIQWLTGVRYPNLFEPVAALDADGHCTLIAPNDAPPTVAADRVATYEAQWHCTLRNDQRLASSRCLLETLGTIQPGRVGLDGPCGPELMGKLPGPHFDIEPTLFQLRRRKHPDELALIRKAIAGTQAMYRRARQIIEPGINELDVFNQLQAAAVTEFGEMLTGTGNDYACGAKGGPPRNRQAADGELYILDLGPAFRGYFADNCRTIAVNGQPSDAQQQAWEQIAAVFPMVEANVRPGVSCKEFFNCVQTHLDSFQQGGFDHHLGHGIGLNPHEGPHLNPYWDDTFQLGDVFTVEPGLYGDHLRQGIRLENNYLVTEDGVQCLTEFSLDLCGD